MGCEPGCSKNPPGDVFASNYVAGNHTQGYGVGHQGPFANNWLYDNTFADATPGEYIPEYMQVYTTSEVSIFDPEDTSVTTHHQWVDRGYLVEGTKRTLVGTKASDLQKLIDTLPPPTPLANVTALVNSSQLRRLRLTGAYTGDVTLHLPSLFVLALDEGTTYSGAAAGWVDGSNLIEANGTFYTAVVGGVYSCSDMQLSFHGSTGIFGHATRVFTMTNVKVSHCGLGRNYSTGNVMVQNGVQGEISYSEFFGGSRGIWLERNNGLAVHHNHVHDCGPLIDVDNGNNGVLLYSNSLENTRAYGLWMEVNAEDCWVFNSEPNTDL